MPPGLRGIFCVATRRSGFQGIRGRFPRKHLSKGLGIAPLGFFQEGSGDAFRGSVFQGTQGRPPSGFFQGGPGDAFRRSGFQRDLVTPPQECLSRGSGGRFLSRKRPPAQPEEPPPRLRGGGRGRGKQGAAPIQKMLRSDTKRQLIFSGRCGTIKIYYVPQCGKGALPCPYTNPGRIIWRQSIC